MPEPPQHLIEAFAEDIAFRAQHMSQGDVDGYIARAVESYRIMYGNSIDPKPPKPRLEGMEELAKRKFEEMRAKG